MNLSVLKHSHKAQILEMNHSLKIPVCSPVPAQGAQTGAVGSVRIQPCSWQTGAVCRGTGWLCPLLSLQAGPPAFGRSLCLGSPRAVWCCSGPSQSSPKDVSGQGSPDVSRSSLHCQDCPYPVWPWLQTPSVCLWKTTWTQKVIPLYKVKCS